MGALPPIRRLLVEDFPSQKLWIAPLLLIFNSFTESVVNALNKGLTISDNTTGDIKTVTLSNVPTTTKDSNAVGPTSINWTKPNAPSTVIVGSVVQYSGTPMIQQSFVLASSVQVQWGMSSDGNYILITGVVGITPTQTTQYKLTLLCL